MTASPHQQASHGPSPRKESKVKVALVCDWLTTPGGAEKVLLELHRMYPQAPIYTSQYSKQGINWFDDADVRTGWLQIFPRGLRKFLGPLRQLYFSHLDLSDYYVVISVTGAEAKAVRTKPKNHQKTKKTAKKHPNLPLYHTSPEKSIENAHQGAYHLCFCHVPTQYYWQMYDQYLQNPGFGIFNPLVRFFFKLLVKPLRQADYRSAQQPDQFITISEYAKSQIEHYYHREAVIVAPPVEVEKFMPAGQAFAPKSDFSTTESKKSTGTANFSTKNPQPAADLSTESASFSTETEKLSTKIAQNSTKNTNLSTVYPQPSTNLSTESTNLSTSSPQGNANFSTKTPDLSTEHSKLSTTPPNYYIIACRQVTWKRVDLAIEACKKLRLPLKVVGDGSEHQRLVQLAATDSNIEFIPWAGTRELAELLQHAKAYIFPSLEPFGVAAVEALAAGCPVIALSQGGSQDFIIDRVNGLLFPEQTVASLTQALREFSTLHLDRQIIPQTAQKFSTKHFRQGITDLVARVTFRDQPTHIAAHSPTTQATTQNNQAAHAAAQTNQASRTAASKRRNHSHHNPKRKSHENT